MIRNLSSSVLRMTSETVSVKRQAPTVIGMDGILGAPGAPTVLSVPASVQPVPGRELARLPEGLRVRDIRVIFSQVSLQVSDQNAGTKADLVVLANGDTYEVQLVQPWSLGGYCRAIIARVGY